MPYYAVAKGRKPGIYTTWMEAQRQIQGFHSPKFKKFEKRTEAEEFCNAPQTLLNFLHRDDPKEGDNTLIVFTDGACSANGQEHARASYATVWPQHPELDSAHNLPGINQTNNRAEMMAIIHAMHQAQQLDPENKKTLIIYTDSMLLVKMLSEWIYQWKRNNWVKADGEPISNIDLVHTLDSLMQTRKIALRHVRAHTGAQNWESIFNDKVDKLARKGA